MNPKPCKVCSSPYHSAWYHKERKPMVATKPMNKVGRVGRATANAVSKWKQTQQPNHQGYYECYICHRKIDYLMAEHVKSKARSPELRNELTNLKPTCADCNRIKGSKSNLYVRK